MTEEFFTDLTINGEIVTRPAEHEIFLSFVNDEDAVSFYEWLNAEGLRLFNRYRKREKAVLEGDI